MLKFLIFLSKKYFELKKSIQILITTLIFCFNNHAILQCFAKIHISLNIYVIYNINTYVQIFKSIPTWISKLIFNDFDTSIYKKRVVFDILFTHNNCIKYVNNM